MTPNDPTTTQAPPESGDSSEAAWDAGLAAAFGPAETGSFHPAADPGAGAILAGKYRLSERIGEGGMGSVWVAHQSEPVKRKVAVKLVKTGMDSKSVLARFEAERQALAVMDHPNIAKVLDGGLHDGRPFFVMELVKGVPITEYCDAGKLTPNQRLELFVPVCQAIQHAHQKGIIHRDIKPSNVLIALYDDRPVPKVIDFGIAKATGGTLTERTVETAFGGVVGTPQYMSPEQASLNNLDIDTRSDVYSLGVLLYELLTGTPPFSRKELEKKGLLEILRAVREDEPPRPSVKLSTADLLPSLSANRGTEPKKLTGLLRSELDWIVMKALEKDRSRRYDTANGFAADVQRYLSGEAVQAHPPSAGYRLRKFVQKNRGAVLAGSMVVLSLLAGLVATSYGFYRADIERQKAEGAERSAIQNALAAMDAATAETAAKVSEVEQRRLAEYRAATVSVDAALQAAGWGSGEGLVRLAGTLKTLPPDATALRQGVATNLLVWGQLIVPASRRPPGRLYAISPDGRVGLIALRSDGAVNSVYTWEARDLVTGKQLAQLGGPETAYTGHYGNEYVDDDNMLAVFSGDGQVSATLHESGTPSLTAVRVWDTATWKERFHLHPARITYEVRLNRDGSRVATRSAERNPAAANEEDRWRPVVQLWDARNGTPVAALDHGGKTVDHLRFAPSGDVLVSTGERVVRVWSAADGKLLHTLDGHADPIAFTEFSPSGRMLAVAAGKQVYWWNVSAGTPAGPPIALGFEPSRSRTDYIPRFAFETEDVLIVRAWSTFRDNWGHRVGSAVCVRGEAKAHALDAACTDGTYVLTDDRHVYSLSPFRRMETPPGRKFPPEVRAAANGRRYVQIGRTLFDLVAEVPVGPELHQPNSGIDPVRAAGFGYVVRDQWQDYWSCRQQLIPDPDSVPPDDVLVLWARVLARGHIDTDSGLFKNDDEGTWERNRRELARRVEPVGQFPFPGPVVTDPHFWLKKAYAEAKDDPARLTFAERLVAADSSRQNYLRRAYAYGAVGRGTDAIKDDLRANELPKGEIEDRDSVYGKGPWTAAADIVKEPGRRKDEYELVLRWYAETTGNTELEALALYRLDRPAEALKLLMDEQIPRPTDMATALAAPWAAAAVAYTHARALDRQWRDESILPFVVEALCHHKLGHVVAARQRLETARRLIRGRTDETDLLHRGFGFSFDFHSVVSEVLQAVPPPPGRK